jgi:ApbE superfamily uncharacterized protein (UPF0280 family)
LGFAFLNGGFQAFGQAEYLTVTTNGAAVTDTTATLNGNLISLGTQSSADVYFQF